MATILGDPGIRGTSDSMSNTMNQMQQAGDSAIANRQNVGSGVMSQLQEEATRTGLSMGTLLRQNEDLSKSVYNSLIGINRGDQNMATNMFKALANGKETNEQKVNRLLYDEFGKISDDQSVFDTAETKIKTVLEGYTKSEQGGSLTSEDVAGIASEVTNASLWTPFADYIGEKPTNGDPENPVWSSDFDATRTGLLQHYLQDPSMTIAKFKAGGSELRGRFVEAMKNGLPPAEVLTGLNKTEGEGAPRYLAEGVPEDRAMTKEEAMAVWQKQLNDPKYNPMSTYAESPNQPIQTVDAKNNWQQNTREDVAGERAQGEIAQGTAGPVSFYNKEASTTEVKPVYETSTITTPGILSQMKALEGKARAQAGTRARGTIVDDTDFRAAQTDIAYKQALTAQAYAQTNNMLAQIEAGPAMDDITKKILTDEIETYNGMREKQDVKSLLGMGAEERKAHNDTLRAYQERAKRNGFSVELVPISQLNIFGNVKDSDKDTLTYGGLAYDGYGGSGSSGGGQVMNVEDSLNNLYK